MYRGYKTTKKRNRSRRKSRAPINNTKLGNWIGVAQKALRVATHVASIINSEAKYLDPNVNSGSATSAGTITCLTGIARGTGPSDRVGDSILLKSVYIPIITKFNTGNTDSPSYVRYMLIRDLNDESDTAPTLASLLTYPTAPASALSPLNMNYENRFQLLADVLVCLDSSHGIQRDNIEYEFKPNQNNPTKNQWHAHFNGTNGTDTGKGHLYLITIGSGTTNMNTTTYAGRLFFYDN